MALEAAAMCSGSEAVRKRDVAAVVSANVPLAPGYRMMRLTVPELAGAILPGQFFQIRIDSGGSGLFLRRPFAPSEYHDDGFSFVYAVVGKGTECLAAAVPGQAFGVLAPLGNAFTPAGAGERAVLFGGGYGAPSLAPLALALEAAGAEVVIILGARNVRALLNREAFDRSGRLVTATDDGSHGCRGTVIDAFHRDVGGDVGAAGERTRFYACGPVPMLKAVAALAEKRAIPCEVSLEERMACGFGACMGCAVPTPDGRGGIWYRRVCHEGPVFRSDGLLWDEM